ncbi:hypothetical protein ACFFSY_30520 [Paenibacillus aurantiacus]|uniref:Extracellular solute-binding protein n=1 Tax=Paenibacillus aurantiacus TaxID=1936118 RepID=A0ABV5KYL0_9BACL
MKRTKRFAALLLILSLFGALLAGCGDEPDLTVFIMPKEYINPDAAKKLEDKVQAGFGETKSIAVNASPMYNAQKLVVEIAAAGNGIIVMPKDALQMMIEQGPAVQLDDTFKAADYPDGVMDSMVEGENGELKKVKGLFAIPVDQMPAFKAAGYEEKDVVAIIPVNAPDQQLSKQVMKELMKP